VPLPGGSRASQNDIFVLAKSKAGPAAIMVEGKDRTGWPDYEAFLRQFGVKARVGNVQRIANESPIPLFAVWVTGNCSYLKS
jgi:hypothetical protein